MISTTSNSNDAIAFYIPHVKIIRSYVIQHIAILCGKIKQALFVALKLEIRKENERETRSSQSESSQRGRTDDGPDTDARYPPSAKTGMSGKHKQKD
ncbi:Uncharacterised protein [Salmonella enterica subsp. enterica]|nr:Uncharacterised protein [Salmonella enterica subsp. enterica]